MNMCVLAVLVVLLRYGNYLYMNMCVLAVLVFLEFLLRYGNYLYMNIVWPSCIGCPGVSS